MRNRLSRPFKIWRQEIGMQSKLETTMQKAAARMLIAVKGDQFRMWTIWRLSAVQRQRENVYTNRGVAYLLSRTKREMYRMFQRWHWLQSSTRMKKFQTRMSQKGNKAWRIYSAALRKGHTPCSMAVANIHLKMFKKRLHHDMIRWWVQKLMRKTKSLNERGTKHHVLKYMNKSFHRWRLAYLRNKENIRSAALGLRHSLRSGEDKKSQAQKNQVEDAIEKIKSFGSNVLPPNLVKHFQKKAKLSSYLQAWRDWRRLKCFQWFVNQKPSRQAEEEYQRSKPTSRELQLERMKAEHEGFKESQQNEYRKVMSELNSMSTSQRDVMLRRVTQSTMDHVENEMNILEKSMHATAVRSADAHRTQLDMQQRMDALERQMILEDYHTKKTARDIKAHHTTFGAENNSHLEKLGQPPWWHSNLEKDRLQTQNTSLKTSGSRVGAYRRFESLDINNDGVIDRAEWSKAMGSEASEAGPFHEINTIMGSLPPRPSGRPLSAGDIVNRSTEQILKERGLWPMGN